MIISSLNSFIVLLVGTFLGIYVIISSREKVKRKVHLDPAALGRPNVNPPDIVIQDNVEL